MLFRASLIFLCLAGPVAAMKSSQGPLTVTAMATGLTEPWGIAFLPGGDALITERGGRLLRLRQGHLTKVAGTPEVFARGQGGLLDVMVPQDFARTRQVYLTYAAHMPGGSGTALGRGTLSKDGLHLSGFETIFRMTPAGTTRHHFGSRLVEGRDGLLYMTIGERGTAPDAQDLSRHSGSVLRLTRDGKPAPGNPFTGTPGALPEIWSYGHRNPQGLTLDLRGNLIEVEHGAKGGDEINRIGPGRNYGWPVISYGTNYDGTKIGEGTAKPGMEQPAFFWDPSIAPSGAMVYSGKLWPSWRGDIFVGSLKFDMISRVEPGPPMTEAERLKSRETGRVRDIREAPDGSIWFLSVDRGAAYRITP